MTASHFQIYSSHFGLRERPFSLLPDPDFLFWSANHAKAYAMLEYGIATLAPITVITGEIGAGKTTLIRQLLRAAPQDLRIGLISNALGHRGGLLHWILSALGQDVAAKLPYARLFAHFEALLRAELAVGRHTVLVFDEAQNLSARMLEELRCFSNVNGEKDELLQIILVGQPELNRIIGQPQMLQFAQRVSAQFDLSGLSPEAGRGYIAHRLKVAGTEREIFTPAACDLVHLASRGLPRVINQICDYALVYAFADDLTTIDADMVRDVVADRHNQPLNLDGAAASARAEAQAPSLFPSIAK